MDQACLSCCIHSLCSWPCSNRFFFLGVYSSCVDSYLTTLASLSLMNNNLHTSVHPRHHPSFETPAVHNILGHQTTLLPDILTLRKRAHSTASDDRIYPVPQLAGRLRRCVRRLGLLRGDTSQERGPDSSPPFRSTCHASLHVWRFQCVILVHYSVYLD